MGSKPWHDKKTLEKMYYEQNMNLKDMAEHFDCSRPTIAYWMDKHDLERRPPATERDWSGSKSPRWVPYARLDQGPSGHEQWRSRADDRCVVAVHRLAAVAWFGYETVVESHIHHKNGIPWDNRKENLEPMNPSEHKSMHAYERDRNDKGDFA
jgi:hypothetical protein